MKEAKRDNQAVEAIQRFRREKKRMPSFRELGELVGLRSTNAVAKLVQRLSRDGVVIKDRTGRLIPGRGLSTVKMLGVVEAGFPSPAEEDLLDSFTLDDWLIRNRESSFALTVKGDSMQDAGIREGDVVVVERGRSAKPGDIVIAEVDREWTMKYFRKKGNKVWLEPANKRYKPIYPKEELDIAAVVVGVVRRYR